MATSSPTCRTGQGIGEMSMSDMSGTAKWYTASEAVFNAFVDDYDGPHTDIPKLITELEKRGWKYDPEPEYTRWVWSRWTAHPVEHITHDALTLQPVCGARLVPNRMNFAAEPTGLAPECERCKRREEARKCG